MFGVPSVTARPITSIATTFFINVPSLGSLLGRRGRPGTRTLGASLTLGVGRRHRHGAVTTPSAVVQDSRRLLSLSPNPGWQISGSIVVRIPATAPHRAAGLTPQKSRRAIAGTLRNAPIS